MASNESVEKYVYVFALNASGVERKRQQLMRCDEKTRDVSTAYLY